SVITFVDSQPYSTNAPMVNTTRATIASSRVKPAAACLPPTDRMRIRGRVDRIVQAPPGRGSQNGAATSIHHASPSASRTSRRPPSQAPLAWTRQGSGADTCQPGSIRSGGASPARVSSSSTMATPVLRARAGSDRTWSFNASNTACLRQLSMPRMAEGATSAVAMPMMASTTMTSSRVKPDSGSRFAPDVGIDALPARTTVRAEGIQRVGTLPGWRGRVLVRVVPRIQRHFLVQVRPRPAAHAGGIGRRVHQQGQPLGLGGEAADVQPQGLQGAAEHLDLGGRRLDLGLVGLAEQARADQSHDQADDHQDHDHFEEGEAAGKAWTDAGRENGGSLHGWMRRFRSRGRWRL